MGWLIAKRFAELFEKNLDPSGSITNIPIEHNKIHQGLGFETDSFITLTGQTPKYVLVKTNGCFSHFKELIVIAEKNDVLLTAFRDPVISNDGDPLDYSNSNENFHGIELANVDLFNDPTVTEEGEMIRGSRKYLPGLEGQGQTVGGGQYATDWERVLKPNSLYLRKLERLEGTGECRVLLHYNWYEIKVGDCE